MFEELLAAAEPGTGAWAERATDAMRAYIHLGDFTYGIELGEKALALFEDLDLAWTDESVRMVVTLAGAYHLRGDLARATRLLDRMIARAGELGSPLALGSAHWNAARNAMFRGRLTDGLAHAERALALFGETDRLRNLAALRTTYGAMLAEAGRADEAREHLLAGRERLREVGSVSELTSSEAYLSRVALSRGDLGEAAEWARSAHERSSAGLPFARAEALLATANVLLASGDEEEAARHADELEAGLASAEPSHNAVITWQEIAALREGLGDAEGAVRAYRASLRAAGYRPAATVNRVRR